MIRRAIPNTAFAGLLPFLIPALLAAQDASALPSVTSSRAFKLSGYTQVLAAAQDEGADGFSIHRSRFTLAAELLKNIRFKAAVDLVKSPVLVDAQIELVLHEAASLRIGQFKIPFSLEMTTSSADLDTINRSQAVSKLSPGLDIGSSGRDIGAALFGKAAFLEYTLGVFNGAGINKADTNDGKDVAGRLIVRPLGFLALGVSFYDGSTSASTGEAGIVRDRLGLDLALLRGPFSLKADLINAEDGGTMRRGWYVQTGYVVLPKVLQIVLKADSYDADTSASGDRADLWTAGLNWFLAERTKLQINFELTRNEDGRTVNRALLVQFQGGF